MHIGLNAQLLSLSGDYRAAGISWYIYNLLAHLPSQGHRYTAFVGEPQVRGMWPHLDLRLSRLPTERPSVRILWEQILLPWHLLKEGIDLLHSLAFVLPLWSPRPGVVTIYDLSFVLCPEGLNPWRRLYLRALTPLSARRAKMVIVLAESTKEDLARIWGISREKIRVIPCGVDPTFRPRAHGQALSDFRRHRGLPERFILFVGTLEPRKNVTALVEAYAQLKGEVPHSLVLVGAKGWRGEEVLAQIERSGLSDKVLFVGYVEPKELPLWYNAADLFVFPSLYEGFGLPPLEAMACGTPVIASYTSSLPEVVGEAGVLVDPHSLEGMAQAMRKVLGDGELREEMRRKGLERAKGFSWPRVARETVLVYQEAMGRGGV